MEMLNHCIEEVSEFNKFMKSAQNPSPKEVSEHPFTSSQAKTPGENREQRRAREKIERRMVRHE